MTSFECKEINLFGWCLYLRLQGKVCHLIGSLLQMKIKMLNFYKSISLMKLTKLTLEWQSQIISDQEILLVLQQSLHVHNISVRELKSAYDFVH